LEKYASGATRETSREMLGLATWRGDSRPSLRVLKERSGNAPAGSWFDDPTDEGGDVIALAGRFMGLDPTNKSDFPQILEECANLLGLPFERNRDNGATQPTFKPAREWTTPPLAEELAAHYGLAWADFEAAGFALAEAFIPFAEKKLPCIAYPVAMSSGVQATKFKTLARCDGRREAAVYPAGLGEMGLIGADDLARCAGASLLISGGEEKLLAARKAGFHAVSLQSGEKAPDAGQIRMIAQAGASEIIIGFDADEAGRWGALAAARSLAAAGQRVRVLWWPWAADNKRDLTDELRDRGPEALAQLIQTAQPFDPSQSDLEAMAAWIGSVPADQRGNFLDPVFRRILRDSGGDKAKAALSLAMLRRLAGVGVSDAKDKLKKLAKESERVEKEKKAQRQTFQNKRKEAQRALARQAGQWWRVRSEKRPEFEARADSQGGAEVVEWFKGREGEEFSKVLATCVYRKIETRWPANDEGTPIATFEIFAQGKTTRFEADPGAPNGRDWLATLKKHAPPSAFIDTRAVNALNALASAIEAVFPPQEIILHKPGFTADLSSYRVPGWVISASGFEPEGESDICPRGWGKDGAIGLTPDSAGEQSQRIARAYADHWGALFPDSARATAAFAGALLGPFLKPLAKSPCNLVMVFHGGSGTGKTTVAELALALQGNVGEKLDFGEARNSTANGVVAKAAAFRDSLLFIDDAQVKHVGQLAYAAFSGGGREACDRSGQSRPRPPMRCATLISTESLDGAAESMVNRPVPIAFEALEGEAKQRAIGAAKAIKEQGDASCLAAAAVRQALELREGLPGAYRQLRSLATLLGGESRGGDLAALLALAVHLAGKVFLFLLGEKPAWLVSPLNAARFVVDANAATASEAKPCFRFLTALEASLAAGGELILEHAVWDGSPNKFCINSNARTGTFEPRPDQTRLWRVSGAYGDFFAVQLDKAIRSLKLVDSVQVVHESLKNSKIVTRLEKGKSPRITVRFKESCHRSRLTLIPAGALDGPFGHAGQAAGGDGKSVSNAEAQLETSFQAALDTLDTLDTLFHTVFPASTSAKIFEPAPPLGGVEKEAAEKIAPLSPVPLSEGRVQRVQRVQSPPKAKSANDLSLGHALSEPPKSVSKSVSNRVQAPILGPDSDLSVSNGSPASSSDDSPAETLAAALGMEALTICGAQGEGERPAELENSGKALNQSASAERAERRLEGALAAISARMEPAQREEWGESAASWRAKGFPQPQAEARALEDIFQEAIDKALDWAASALSAPRLTLLQAAENHFRSEGEPTEMAFMRALALVASPFPPDAPFREAARVLLGNDGETAPLEETAE
jgi:hypothetical protein